MTLCDIGNTSFHFLINDIESKVFLNKKLPKIEENIYFISVNEKETKVLKETYSKVIDLEEFIEFKTNYKGMGIDRKLACLGLKDAVIIDAGSAITVDIMKDSEHIGGFILPGITSILKNYSFISTKLKHDINLKVNLDTIPLNTQDAISYAILKSIILPIKELVHNKKVIITGGDGELLSSFFRTCEYKPNLIFDNMKGIISANNSFA